MTDDGEAPRFGRPAITQESYTANKLFKAGIGTNNVDGNPRLCMTSAAADYISTFGADEQMGCYEDIDHAPCFFITGSNTAECHPIIWEPIRDRQRAYPDDTFIVVVDPCRTRTAARADLHLQVRPGTDVALYNAMLHQFVENGFINREMVDDYLTFKRSGGSGAVFDDFTAHVAQYPPERAAESRPSRIPDCRAGRRRAGGRTARGARRPPRSTPPERRRQRLRARARPS